jgi:hypothetical protein
MTPSPNPVAEDLWDESLDGSPPSKRPGDSASKAWRIVLVVATVLWLFVAVENFSDVSLNLIILALLCVFGMVLAMAWASWTFCLAKGLVRLRSRFELAQWAFVPLAGLLGVILLMVDFDLDLRLRLSEAALLRSIAERSPIREVDIRDNPRRVGLFWFESIDGRDGCILMRSNDAFEEGGLIYCMNGRPPQWSPEYSFRHVRGPWWLYENNY